MAAVLAALVVLGGVGAVVLGDDDGGDGPSASPSTTAEPEPVEVEADCAAWDALAGDEVTPGGDDAPLPGDDDLVVGTLDNDLDYFVRHNERPGDGVILALAVDAGAALEDDDQSGAAHYLEHMLFNGTEGYPGNELTDALARLGVEFGADLNAFTNEDETVYYLDLRNDAESIERGLDILVEWATRATIRPEDVEEERGVVLEERRTRLDVMARFFQRVQDLALADTPYEGKRIIGTEESLRRMDADALRRFYDDWYRPDLMSVIAVGDIDPAGVEAQIRERFAALPAADGPTAPVLEVERSPGPRLRTYVDDELPGTSAEVIFTVPRSSLATRGDVRARLLRQIGLDVLSDRLNDDAARGLVPFYEVDVDLYQPVDEFESVFVSTDADPEQLRDALAHVLAELARLRRDGLGDDEVARAVADRRAVARADLEAAPTAQDGDVAFQLVDAALDGTPTTPAEPYARLELELLDGIGAGDVAAELRRVTACSDMAVQAGVPSEYAEHLPDEGEIAAAIVAATGDGALGAREAEGELPSALMATPEPARPIGRSDAGLGYGPARYLEYGNGARVVINPSDIHAGFFRIDGESAGGLAEVDEADLASGRVASRLVSRSGAGDLDTVELARVLAGRNVDVRTSLDVSTEHILGSGSTSDAESVFQLLHLRMVSPRVDDGAVATLRGESRLTAEDPTRSADGAVTDVRDELLWRNDPRYRGGLRADDLDALDPVQALQIHRRRFGDVSDFVFTIVGDIDLDTAEDLADRYIGTIPGRGRIEDASHIPPRPPDEVLTRIVEAGAAAQGRLEVVYDVEVAVDPVLRDHGRLLVAVLRNQLRDRIREELGASYSPDISLDLHEPTDRARLFIRIDSDPDRIDEVAVEVQTVLDAIRTRGPSGDALDLALEPMLRDLRFIDLAGISEDWLYLLTHLDGAVEDVPAAAELRLDGITPDDVRALAAQLLPDEAYVQITQLPAP